MAGEDDFSFWNIPQSSGAIQKNGGANWPNGRGAIRPNARGAIRPNARGAIRPNARGAIQPNVSRGANRMLKPTRQPSNSNNSPCDSFNTSRPAISSNKPAYGNRDSTYSHGEMFVGSNPHRKSGNINAKREYIQKRPPGLGYRTLDNVSQLYPEKVLTTLFCDQNNLNVFLVDEDPKKDIIVLFVLCLSKISTAELHSAKTKFLVTVCRSNFMSVLQKYIFSLPYVKIVDKKLNLLFWKDIDLFFINVLKFSEAVIDLSPSTAVEVFRIILDTIKISLEGLRTYHKERISDELVHFFEDVQMKLAICIEEAEKKTPILIKNELGEIIGENILPPNNFRDIEILPSKEDLFQRPDFLRPNIVEGAYSSVEHYLDVQFRLMREDFISPLRNALKKYMDETTNNKYKFSGARFYKNAKFINYAVHNGALAVEICFNEKLLHTPKKKKMMYTKRFMFGSLLCLTCDNFKTIILCSVDDRDNIENGLISAEVFGSMITEDMFGKPYLLVESETYFPPYYHVLKALQNPILATSFPFEEYIVKVQATDGSPKYLQRFTDYSLFKGKTIMLHQVLTVEWTEKFGLDKTQYNAYIMALMREFVTIQGPPGTGKTYVGLMIASTLLRNCYLHSPQPKMPPILVVCYTNHALDQFLEGLLKVTNKLVRIGGQSKNETLKKYNLSRMRRSGYQNVNLKMMFSKCLQRIEVNQNIRKSLQSRKHIFSFENSIFKMCAPLNLFTFLKKFIDGKRPALVNWLLLTDLRNYKYHDSNFDSVQLISKDNNESISSDDSQSSDEVGYYECESDDDIHRPAFLIDNSTGVENLVIHSEYSYDQLKKHITNLKESPNTDQQIIEDYTNELEHLKMRLNRGDQRYAKIQMISPEGFPRTAESFSAEERWSLYWEWVGQATLEKLIEYNKYIEIYKSEKSAHDELVHGLDLDVLRNSHVVGITTSGAARLQSVLRSLHSPIVIVEEAAEVMESHVLVALTKSCDHLIMIGDHQQLRPITAAYEMAKKFNLDISLFERMVKNGSHCYQLGVQHRMRPEIANLITPAIYKDLLNHQSVLLYKPIKGVSKNLFFIDHTVPESKVDDISSRLNDHEAQFILFLAKYLIQQGYQPDEITILAAYSGQMFHFRKLRQDMPALRDVRISVLDNFQGEENKIILLSLVRNNPEGNIGFLSTDNRVCVALSRAKEGFYILGNMSMLKKKSSLWNSVDETLTKQNCIGSKLILQCQIHENTFTSIQTLQDFSQVPEGGCIRKCESLLNCGHYCKSVCHPYDRKHKDFKCLEMCSRPICHLLHNCPLKCFQVCCPCKVPVKRVLQCEHEVTLACSYDYQNYKCVVLLDVELPDCGHLGMKKCHEIPEQVKCSVPCKDRLACGHACRLFCHKKTDPDHLQYKCQVNCCRTNKGCTQNHICKLQCFETCPPCTIKVSKIRTCTHIMIIDCHVDVNTIPCLEKCRRSLKCGHHCKMTCKDACDLSVCLVSVAKKRSCGHSIKVKCSIEPDTVKCAFKCLKKLPCGHPCLNLCYQACDRSKCRTLVPNPFSPLCGHTFKIPCSETTYEAKIGPLLTMKYCKEMCKSILEDCEHACRGTCGQCAGGRLHVPCAEPCGLVLVCGHSCTSPCREACPPCTKKCEVRCTHSRCPYNCGVPCPPCKEKCTRKCVHNKCIALCGEECNVPLCSEACPKRLPCKHRCRGLCGEKCPQICNTCKPDQFPDIFFGTEDNEDARFIQLLDCPHAVEVNSLDKYMEQQQDGEIKVPTCPHCKTPIVNTPRYSAIIKQIRQHVEGVKQKLFGDGNENQKKLSKLKINTSTLVNSVDTKTGSNMHIQLKTLMDSIQYHEILNKKNQISRLSVLVLNKYSFTYDILKIINDMIVKVKDTKSEIINHQVNIIINAISSNNTNVSQQQVKDINNEISRLNRLIDYTEMINKPMFKSNPVKFNEDVHYLESYIMFSLKPFDLEINKNLLNRLNIMRKQLYLSPITEQEKQMIVKVMGFKQGHWYTCPNGHPYCIADCGGATVTSVCPECKAQIGGTSHRLLSSNRVATFMDGSVHGAWPATANINDYQL